MFSVRMLSHGQKRVWRYVEEGSLLKLKSYLRKHRDLDVNFSQGKRQRSPLHLACELGDDAALRLLLKHGADVLQKDRKGNTALHTAANRALKYGKIGIKLETHTLLLNCILQFVVRRSLFSCLRVSAYDDLVVPLKKSCPQALNAPNSAGVTPEDLLNWIKHKEVLQT